MDQHSTVSSRQFPPAASTDRPEPDVTRELVFRAKNGDGAALERMLARSLPRVRRWARGRIPTSVRGQVDTCDLLQEVAMHACRKLATFVPDRPGSFDAYLRRGVINRIRDEIRKAGRRPRPTELSDDLTSSQPSPVASAESAQWWRRYRQALKRLTPRDRSLVRARVELDWDAATAAAQLGLPSEAAARVAIRRALNRLAPMLTEPVPAALSPAKACPRMSGSAA